MPNDPRCKGEEVQVLFLLAQRSNAHIRVLLYKFNGRNSEHHPSSLEDGRVVTDEDKANGRPSRETASPILNKKIMKSTIVIYGHESELTKADAKRIAFLLGAQTTCTRHICEALMNGVENIVLCLPSINAEGAEREWQEFIDTFHSMNLTGKCLAIYVPYDSLTSERLNNLKYVLYQRNVKHIINPLLGIQHYSIDNWISAISPNL